MGGADVIPGVSGGTIAFISGIYDELLHAIKSIDADALLLLRKMEWAAFWRKINGSFLIAVLLGIVTSLISLAKVMTWLLKEQPIAVWSFFFGLILISAPLIMREIKRWTFATACMLVLGIAIAYLITVISPAQTPDNLAFIFFCGALAICAMILPGISGAFILLLLGKYEFMIHALTSFNLSVILIFAAGCAVGLITFARVLSWMLDNFRFPALALLAGFMIGSLNKVWPWKEVVSYRVNHEGQQVPAFDKSILPADYYNITGNDPHVFQAIFFAALGIFLIVAIEKVAAVLKSKH